ncbi:MAG TPA: hypothetical protein VHA05_03045 [Candidatus Saccharimonadales bacterium]|nr:hypothetical protein [Candidatus Saccharimonadales bacterium]
MAQYLPEVEIAVACTADRMIMSRKATQLSDGYAISTHPFFESTGHLATMLRSAGAYLIPEKGPGGEETEKIREAFLIPTSAFNFAYSRSVAIDEPSLMERLCERTGAILLEESGASIGAN